MTALGLIMIPITDILFKLQTLINVLFLPFRCSNKDGMALNSRIREYTSKKIMRLTDMNEYEIESFKKQSKYTQLIFEDLLMIVLDAFVILGVFSVPLMTSGNFSGGILLMQIGSTSLSIYTALNDLFFWSDALGEDRLEYLLFCLKAKQNWIPYGM
jgi:hypothetical protein